MAVARFASRRAHSSRAELGGRPPLVIGAIVTFVAAITFDALAGEHPTHTVALAFVALAVAGLRLRLDGRREGLVSVVSGAVVAQPVLHATAKPDTGATHHASGGLLHMLLTDGPGAAMQLAVSAAIVIAVATSGRIAQLLLTALRRPVRLLLVSGPPPPRARARPGPPVRPASRIDAALVRLEHPGGATRSAPPLASLIPPPSPHGR